MWLGIGKSIEILEIQREGKKIQKIEEFILGSQIKKGSLIIKSYDLYIANN